MKIRPLSVAGAWEITPVQYGDPRGMFLEWYKADALAAEVGHPLDLRQGNLSVSARGVLPACTSPTSRPARPSTCPVCAVR